MLKLGTQHWSIRKRLYIVALVAGFSVVQSIAVNFFLLREYSHNVEHISEGELVKLRNIANIFKELSDIHTQLFNLLRKDGKGKNEQTIYLLGGKLLDRIDKLHSSIAKHHATAIVNQEYLFYETTIKSIGDVLDKYRHATSVAIEMSSVNVNLSEKYMLKASDSFNELNNLLSIIMSNVVDHIDHEMKEELESIADIYWPLSIIVVLIALLIAPLIFRILRDLSENFVWIEGSLNQLREGNTGIDLSVINTNTEMGRVTDSLHKFRDTLIKVQDSRIELAEQHRLLGEENARRRLTEIELRRSLTELSRAADAVEASNNAKSLFLANMSHEIRTPLNAVLGMAQVLETTALDDAQKEYVETLYKQGHHLLELLNNILDYSKMESGNYQLDYTEFRLDKLLHDVIGMYKNQPSKRQVSLTLDIAPDVENTLYGDPLRIRQILINLLSNAYKFTAAGNINIHVENHREKLACGKTHQEYCPNKKDAMFCNWHNLYVAVSDTGIGIAKDQQQYIFENFTQADETFTRQYGGTGIGLAICKQLVKLMDGEIGVNSEKGQGATFWFRICLPNQAGVEQQQLV